MITIFFSQHKNLYLHFSRENKNDFCLFKNKTFCFEIKKKKGIISIFYFQEERVLIIYLFFS